MGCPGNSGDGGVIVTNAMIFYLYEKSILGAYILLCNMLYRA